MKVSFQRQSWSARLTGLFLSVVIALALVGFFVGLNDGVPREDIDRSEQTGWIRPEIASVPAEDSPALIPATHYSQMRRSETGPTSRWQPKLEWFSEPQYDESMEIKPSQQAKQQSLQTRASRRAFNGAPPVIPHAVEGTDDAACYACHGRGARIGNLAAGRMSHGFLANCTQCHAPPPPQPFENQETSVENSFVGLQAPTQGTRAYSDAPPTIPHSRWMRENCLACHGLQGWDGLESTHPWRTNCTQCHAPSAELDQAITASPVPMLPPQEAPQE